MIKNQGIGDLAQLYAFAKRNGIDYNLVPIPNDFRAQSNEAFDPVYMTRLFDFGFDLGRAGLRWKKAPPQSPGSCQTSQKRCHWGIYRRRSGCDCRRWQRRRNSCKSVVEESFGDQAYIDMVVRSLVAVSLYNRDVDIAQFTISDDDKAALHERFIGVLKKGCEADNDALLAGVIDQAVDYAISKN